MATYDCFIPDFSSQTLFQAEGPSLRFLATVAPLLMDTIPPLVTLVSPVEGSVLQRNTPIVVDVVDPSGTLGFHVIFAKYRDVMGLHEVVFGGVWPELDGTYLVNRQAITGGFRYSFTRRGGWPSRPSIQVRATDLGSGEVM